MSTVKIKIEPTAAADVKVKLEPSLSAVDIKFEQHTSDIGTKIEPGSEADSEEDEENEEGDIKSEYDDASDDEDTDQNQTTEASKNQPQFICKHPGCGRIFIKAKYLKLHQHDHRLRVEFYMYGKTYTISRQSLDDRWPCPILDCTSILIAASTLYTHIRRNHRNTTRQQQQEQQAPPKKTRPKYYFLTVDDFYVNGVRCGYHSTTGVFVCHECRLVPECLLAHLQQKHAFDEKSIDNSALPDSAVNANVNPNTNQHSSNPHLVAAISQPYQQHHQDIIQGWLCVASGCGYCGYTSTNKSKHKVTIHHGEQLTTVPALVLQLSLSKTQTSRFFITRIDQASGAVTASRNRVNRYKLDYSHNGLTAQDEYGNDTDQNETTDGFNLKRQWKCDYDNCDRFFNSSKGLSWHRREHKLEVVINVYGITYTLNRQSADDRWACPISDCEVRCKSVSVTQIHIQKSHNSLVRQKRANSEDEVNQQQQHNIKRVQPTFYYLKVDDFYVGGIRCGHHTTTGLFMCYECKLVPECLLTHLQQKHGYDEKSIDNAVLPESAKIAGNDPNINQRISNSHLAAAISQPSQQHHPDIIQGWCCIAANCGYCGCNSRAKSDHKKRMHRGDQFSLVPALVLRLLYGKTKTSGFLITRLDITTANGVEPTTSMSQHDSDCDGDDEDGDELVLSDYSDEDDTY